jgi:O-antigen ligase
MAVNPAPIGVLVSLYAIAWLVIYRAHCTWPAALLSPMSLIFIGLAGFGLLSSVWAVDSGLAIARAWKFLLVMLPLVLFAYQCLKMPESGGVRCAHALLLGAALAAALLTAQTYGGFLLRAGIQTIPASLVAIKLNVPAAELAILVWCLPACARIAGWSLRAKLLLGIAFGLTLLAVYGGDGLAPRVALGAGAIFWVASYVKPRVATVVVGIAVMSIHAFTLVVVPNFARDRAFNAEFTDRSILHRIEVWDTVGTLIRARPWGGYGFDNSRAIPPTDEISNLTGKPRAIPLYPHNVLLQAQLELGIIGIVFFYAVLIYLLRRSLSFDRVTAASAIAMIAATLSIWCVGYPLWRSAWIAWLGVCAIAICALGAKACVESR